MFDFLKKLKNAAHGRSFEDPVCGMRASESITVEYRGQTYGFCSEHCKQQFEKDPENFTAK